MSTKKIYGIVLFLVYFVTSSFAYNPSVEGENLFLLTTPHSIGDGASVAGGALQYVTAEQIVVNPAAVGIEQRLVLNLGATGFFGKEENSKFGGALNFGMIIPSSYGVFTFLSQGIFVNFPTLDLGNSATLRAGFSKDITDNLLIGIDIGGTFGNSWGVFGDLGFIYNFGTPSLLPFMKDFRIGGSFTSLGYMYHPKSESPLYENEAQTGFPSMITPHIGIAGTVLSAEKLSAGLAFDLSFPTFQNILFDAGLQVLIIDMIRIKTGWEFNLRETLAKKATFYPSVAISVKIGIKTDDESFLAKKGWQQSELEPSVGYKYLSNDIQAVSVGFATHLGLNDTAAPVIKLWGEE